MTQYAVIDPSTGEMVASVPTSTDSEIAAAVSAAHDAYETWGRAISASERGQFVARVARLHEERRDELARIMKQEMGKAIEDALGEVDFCVAIYDYYAEHALELLADQPVPLLDGGGSAVIQRRPLGALLGIMPWNYPAYQVARFAAPNLVLGNTIVLKHAPQCPQSAAALEQIFLDAGLPHGTYVNVYATNEQVERVIADPRIQGVSLTGSERAGSAVAEVAGRHLKKVVLELGGSDPFIVLSANDIDATVEAAVAARMENNGQACNAGKRLIVHENLYDDFLGRFTDRMLAGSAALLSSVGAAERLEQQVQAAIEGGARFDSAGGRAGAVFPPGVLTHVEPTNPAYRDEFFGPVAMVFKVHDEDEAVAVANDTPYGLGSYVFTEDAEQARRVAEALDAGMVFVNGVGAEGAELPFGGVKRSGFGRELGTLGIDEFVNKKLIRTVR